MEANALHLDMRRRATRDEIFRQVDSSLKEAAYPIMDSVALDQSIRADSRFHTLGEIESAIARTPAPEDARSKAMGVYRILAEAEAKVHGTSVSDAHFHEVGAGTSIREVLGICTAIAAIGPEIVTSTAVQVGRGTVLCAHGVLSIPAPATREIIALYKIPTCEERLEGELCTPTSAAVLACIVDRFVGGNGA